MIWLQRWQHYVHRFDRVVWLLVGATFIESLGRFLVDPYLTLFLVGKGVSLGAVGLILSAAPLAGVFMGMVGGSLSDRWGRRPVQVLGVVLSGLALLGFGFAGGSVVVLTLLNFMNGMSRALYRPAVQASIVDVTSSEMRSEAFGLRRVVLNIGAAIGPVIGLLIYHWIPSLGFWLAGSMLMAVGLYLAVAVPETKPGRRGRRLLGGRVAHGPVDEPAPSVRAAQDPADRQKAREAEWASWRRTLGDGVLWAWMFSMAVTSGIYRLIDTYLPVHLANQHIPAWVYGTMLPLNAIICVTVQLPLNYWLRRAYIGVVTLVAAVPYALGFLGFGFMRLPALIILSLVLFTTAEVLQAAAQPRFIPELAPPDLRGRYMGVQGLQDLGRAAVPILGGWAMAHWGGQTLFTLAAGLALLGGSSAFVADALRLRRVRRHKAAQDGAAA